MILRAKFVAQNARSGAEWEGDERTRSQVFASLHPLTQTPFPNGPFGTTSFNPKNPPAKDYVGSLFCALSQETRHIISFL